jgi:hypothetical protein
MRLHMLNKALAVARVALRQNLALRIQKAAGSQAVQRQPIGVPATGIGAAAAVQQLLHLRQR